MRRASCFASASWPFAAWRPSCFAGQGWGVARRRPRSSRPMYLTPPNSSGGRRQSKRLTTYETIPMNGLVDGPRVDVPREDCPRRTGRWPLAGSGAGRWRRIGWKPGASTWSRGWPGRPQPLGPGREPPGGPRGRELAGGPAACRAQPARGQGWVGEGLGGSFDPSLENSRTPSPAPRKTRTANEKEPFQPWAELRGLT